MQLRKLGKVLFKGVQLMGAAFGIYVCYNYALEAAGMIHPILALGLICIGCAGLIANFVLTIYKLYYKGGI